jgi:hypothetical protein
VWEEKTADVIRMKASIHYLNPMLTTLFDL